MTPNEEYEKCAERVVTEKIGSNSWLISVDGDDDDLFPWGFVEGCAWRVAREGDETRTCTHTGKEIDLATALRRAQEEVDQRLRERFGAPSRECVARLRLAQLENDLIIARMEVEAKASLETITAEIVKTIRSELDVASANLVGNADAPSGLVLCKKRCEELESALGRIELHLGLAVIDGGAISQSADDVIEEYDQVCEQRDRANAECERLRKELNTSGTESSDEVQGLTDAINYTERERDIAMAERDLLRTLMNDMLRKK